MLTVKKTRLLPRIVVIPVNVMGGGGGLLASGSTLAATGAGFNAKTLRSTIAWYGLSPIARALTQTNKKVEKAASPSLLLLNPDRRLCMIDYKPIMAINI